MKRPIEEAYAALAHRLGQRLYEARIISGPEALSIDDPKRLDAQIDEAAEDQAAPALMVAALFKQETRLHQATMGGGRGGGRFVVERDVQLELGVVGSAGARRKELLADAAAAVCRLEEEDPSLGGAAERVMLTGAEYDDLPPNGETALLSFTLRVRSSDPLGLTP